MTCPLSSGPLYWRKGGGVLEKIWKDGRFWGCVLLFAGLFGLALYFEHIDRYHPFPYIMVFHALTLVSWVWGLYHRRRPGDRRAWGCWVLLSALPQILMCMVSFVAWGLLGMSLVMGIAAIICSEK